MTTKAISVTLIGGFLGAGKTTLVNHLIRNANVRFGVIVNEFGEAGIDGALIERIDEDGIAELSNGCLCCFGRDDLVEALVALAKRPKEQRPEHVLIELSGIADPVPAAQTLLDPYVRQLFTLKAIIGVADARNLHKTVKDNPEGAVQLAYSTVILLNKVDLVEQVQCDEAKATLEKLNPLASVLGVSHGNISFDTLLAKGAFDADRLASDHKTVHTPNVMSFTLRAEGMLDHDAFNDFAEQYLITDPAKVLRVKGFISMKGFEQALVFQSVRDLFTLQRSDKPASGVTELVVIGRALDKDAFQEGLMQCLKSKSWFGSLWS